MKNQYSRVTGPLEQRGGAIDPPSQIECHEKKQKLFLRKLLNELLLALLEIQLSYGHELQDRFLELLQNKVLHILQ